MKRELNKLKREVIPFLIAYIIICVVIIGSLTLAIHTASLDKSLKDYQVIEKVMENFVPNITGFKFFRRNVF